MSAIAGEERTRVVLEVGHGIVFLKVPHRGIQVTAATVERAIEAACRVAGFETHDKVGEKWQTTKSYGLLLEHLLRETT